MTVIDELLQVLSDAKETWRGCEWQTDFGTRNLNLQGLRSRQAAIAAKATRGEESACWTAAAEWLEKVERDAETAARFATEAINAARRGDVELALSELDKAISLQNHYPLSQPYSDLRSKVERFRDQLIEFGQAEPA